MNKCEGVTGTFMSATALEPHRLVKITAAAASGNPAKVGYADADDVVNVDLIVGVTTTRALAADVPVTVEFLHSNGNRVGSATVAIASGALCYQAAAGQLAATGTVKRGIALDAATAANDYFAYAPFQS